MVQAQSYQTHNVYTSTKIRKDQYSHSNPHLLPKKLIRNSHNFTQIILLISDLLIVTPRDSNTLLTSSAEKNFSLSSRANILNTFFRVSSSFLWISFLKVSSSRVISLAARPLSLPLLKSSTSGSTFSFFFFFLFTGFVYFLIKLFNLNYILMIINFLYHFPPSFFSFDNIPPPPPDAFSMLSTRFYSNTA